MYHIIVDAGTIRVLDSSRERFSFKSANAVVAPGHYRLPMVERFSPKTRHFGPGRIFIDELSSRDVHGIVVAEKAVVTFELCLKFDRLPALPIIAKMPQEFSIHGGGETLPNTLCIANYQPLTPSPNGIRLHNADLSRLMTFLEPRLEIQQIVVLTVLRNGSKGADIANPTLRGDHAPRL